MELGEILLGIYYSCGGVFACLSVCMWNSEIRFSGGLYSVKLMIDSMILEVFSYQKDFFLFISVVFLIFSYVAQAHPWQ